MPGSEASEVIATRLLWRWRGRAQPTRSTVPTLDARCRLSIRAIVTRSMPLVTGSSSLICARSGFTTKGQRVLFVAFAEDRGLLPEHTLHRAYEARNPFHPQPVWANFLGLFTAIDRGNPGLNIPQYNGGLFASDPVLDSLNVSNEACERLKRLGDFDYRPPAEAISLSEDGRVVDVEILGHIFEQSISDLEGLRGSAASQPTAREAGQVIASRHKTKRHREGAYYTPAFITRYMLDYSLTPVVADRFEALRGHHRADATKTARAVLDDPRAYDLARLNVPQREALLRFWESWVEELQTIRVVDPSCGSGAFLIEAFDLLHAEYDAAVARLNELRTGGFAGYLFDPDRTILRKNLFGVDVNGSAIEIARLSIWIKTAKRGQVLTDLDHNIVVANSVITDPALDPRARDWDLIFPEVARAGGFDVVVGNPPYVRAEQFVELKPHLESRFQTYHGQADLYVFFFELGLRLLRPGGRLAYIANNKWLKAGYGAPLRRMLAEHTELEEVVDFGHAKQIFPDADTFPCVVVARKPTGVPARPLTIRVCTIPRDQFRIESLRQQIDDKGFDIPQAALGSTGWTLEPLGIENLMQKMRANSSTLRNHLGTEPAYGIKVGMSAAYLLTSEVRDSIVAAHPPCAELFRQYLRGRDLKRWAPEWGVNGCSSSHLVPIVAGRGLTQT